MAAGTRSPQRGTAPAQRSNVSALVGVIAVLVVVGIVVVAYLRSRTPLPPAPMTQAQEQKLFSDPASQGKFGERGEK